MNNEELIKELAINALKASGANRSELEKHCWMVVHEHTHGLLPFEYDIREIDENLYTAVLNHAKNINLL